MAFQEDLEFCKILVVLIPHFPTAKDAIQALIDELKLGSVINWSLVRILFSKINPFNFPRLVSGAYPGYGITDRRDFEKFTFSVLALFDRHKCSDMSIIADVLEGLCLKSRNNRVIYERSEWIKLRLELEILGRTYMSTFEETLVFSYKDIPLLVNAVELEGSPSTSNWVEILAVYGLLEILKIIISYGATLIVPPKGTFDYFLFNVFINRLLLNNDEHIMDRRRALDLIKHNFETQFNGNSRRRLFFINTLFMMFTHKSHNIPEKDADYIQCARIFMKSTPEPFITSAEIKSVLTRLCSGIVPNEKVQPFVEKYEIYFPESREALAPRSLEHLSRFKVRECLRIARSFPYGVESLCLPKPIQDLICLTDTRV